MEKREIKFRAWDVKDKTMREVTRLSNPYPTYTKGALGEGLCWVGMKGKGKTNTSNPIEVHGKQMIILMQFTGLKDKNGKEIYEGDIVEGSTEVYEKGGYRSIERERASVDITIEGVRFSRRPYNKYRKVEVIGNIYENPELLNR